MAKLEVHVDHEAVSRRAAEWLMERLRGKADLLLCLASGDTPTRAYELFTQACLAEPGLARGLRIIKLDEWGGLRADHPASCEHHLRQTVVDPLRLGDRYESFTSNPDDPEAECLRIAQWLVANGPIDAAILGLGLNGHLGFNEPAVELQTHAHVATLSPTSLGHAMVRDCDAAPSYGLTLGMADLLQAREILLVATGPAKRQQLAQSFSGTVTTQRPASLLQLHAQCTVLADAAASPDVRKQMTTSEDYP